MQIKTGLGKVRLRSTLAETIASHQTANGLQILPVHLAHALALEDLPLHHKDPFGFPCRRNNIPASKTFGK